MISTKIALALVLSASGAGCGANTGASSGPIRANGATILHSDHFRSAGSSILTVIQNNVAGMQIQRTVDCPQITVRGRKSLYGPNSPAVYVDGTRAVNTCILETLPVSEVHRIEVYPSGLTARPGYRSNPSGLILIFLKTAVSG